LGPPLPRAIYLASNLKTLQNPNSRKLIGISDFDFRMFRMQRCCDEGWAWVSGEYAEPKNAAITFPGKRIHDFVLLLYG
jgi:hypothetical protein